MAIQTLRNEDSTPAAVRGVYILYLKVRWRPHCSLGGQRRDKLRDVGNLKKFRERILF